MDTAASTSAPPAKARRALRWTLTGCATVAGGMSLFMALHIGADVTARNVGGGPLPVTLEITQNWSMVLIVMLAMGYAELAGEHIRATVFSGRLSPAGKRKSELMVRLVAFAAVVVLTYYSILSAVFSVEVEQVAVGAVPIPVWPVKILLVLGFVLFALQLLVSIVDLLTKRQGNPDDADR
ncbi:TRAP transporter small permease [Saccharomonospora sp. NPDC006951]